MNYVYNNFAGGFGNIALFGGVFGIIWIALIVWSLYWKGRALWKAARLYDKNWFIVLLIVNIFGLLEIFYIYVIAKPKEEKLRATNSPSTPNM